MTHSFIQRLVFLTVLFVAAFLSKTIWAQESPLVQAEILAEVDSIAPKRPFWVLLNIEGGQGKTILWQNPGQAKMPSAFNWQLPEGFRVTATRWHAPEKYNLLDGKQVWGFEKDTSVLFEITPPHEVPLDSDTLETIIRLDAHLEVCENSCEKEKKSFSLTFSMGSGKILNENSSAFEHARATLPEPLPFPVEVSLSPTQITLKFFKGGEMAKIDTLDFYPNQTGVVDIDVPFKTTLEKDHWLISGQRQLSGETEGDYFRIIDGLLILGNSTGGAKTAFSVSAINTIPMSEEMILERGQLITPLSLWLALGFAFVGGMILNLMPCVFPVLALKAFAMVKAGGQSAAHLRQDGISYGLGVLTTFLVVGGVLVGLQGMGAEVGWGFQLQSPAFIFALALIMTLVGLNLLGMYELNAPVFITEKLGADDQGTMGAFSTGVLATVLATPCTAPFMGASLGFALTQPPMVALGVFLALGLGMAFPYVALSFSPKLAAKMPKPGPWLGRVKLWLSVPVFLTVAWLIWVFGTQTGGTGGMLLIVMALLLLPLILYFWRMGKKRSKFFHAIALIGVLSVAHFLYLASGDSLKRSVASGTLEPLGPGIETVAYSPERLMDYRKQGRAVFLNFTASWCITCIVQEKLVFDKRPFQAFMRDNRIIYMVADWTNPNPDIAAILSRYKRQGIPFYLFYPPGSARPAVVLPDILTLDSAIKALRGAL